jgi:hypothetical protein
MSRGMGRVQRATLEVVQKHEPITTYDIIPEVYKIKRSRDGYRYFDPAQHVAVKRALEGLQRKGLVIGFRTQRARDPAAGDGRMELCHTWMTEKEFAKWSVQEQENIKTVMAFNPEYALGVLAKRLEHIERKARAIGLKR